MSSRIYKNKWQGQHRHGKECLLLKFSLRFLPKNAPSSDLLAFKFTTAGVDLEKPAMRRSSSGFRGQRSQTIELVFEEIVVKHSIISTSPQSFADLVFDLVLLIFY